MSLCPSVRPLPGWDGAGKELRGSPVRAPAPPSPGSFPSGGAEPPQILPQTLSSSLSLWGGSGGSLLELLSPCAGAVGKGPKPGFPAINSLLPPRCRHGDSAGRVRDVLLDAWGWRTLGVGDSPWSLLGLLLLGEGFDDLLLLGLQPLLPALPRLLGLGAPRFRLVPAGSGGQECSRSTSAASEQPHHWPPSPRGPAAPHRHRPPAHIPPAAPHDPTASRGFPLIRPRRSPAPTWGCFGATSLC